MDNNRQNPGLAVVLATALAPIAWGTTYIVSTELLPSDRPLFAGLLRALPAGLGLVLVTRARPVGSWWLKAAVLGTLNIGGFFALLFLAAFRLPGGVAAMLGSVQPLLAAGLGAILLGERLRRAVVFAGLLGVGGVALLVLRSDATLDLLGIIAGLAGAAAMASGVVLTKYWGRPVELLAFTAWQRWELPLPTAFGFEEFNAFPSLRSLCWDYSARQWQQPWAGWSLASLLARVSW